MKNSDYWRGRFEILIEAQARKGEAYIETLEREYRRASARIEKEINAWYQRFADNNQISMTEARRLLNTKELEEFKWTVEDYIKYGRENAIDQRWLKQLENASAKMHITRLEALKVQAQQQIEALYGNQLDDLDKLLRRTYIDSYSHTAYEIQRGLNVGWNMMTPNSKQLDMVLSKPWTNDMKTFRDRVWIDKDSLVNTVQTQLTQNILRGDPPDRAIKAIQHQFHVSKSKSARLVMTESAAFSSLAQKDCFKDLGVDRFEIVATLDNLTSELCQSLDGKVVDMKDYEVGVTAPPFHPWCRTTTIPFFDDNFGERAARGSDGKTYYVPSNMTYAEWKKTFMSDGSKDGLTEVDACAILKAKLPINDKSEVYQKLGEKHYLALHEKLNEAPDVVRDVWGKLESDLRVVSATSKRHPCCHGAAGIEMDVSADANGKSWSAPYQTTFHEFGHNIDYIANVKFGNGYNFQPYSYTYKNGAFVDSLKKEINDRVDAYAAQIKADFKVHGNDIEWLHDNGYIGDWYYNFYKQNGTLIGGMPKYSKSMAYTKLEKEIRAIPQMARSDISDMIEGVTKGKVNGGFGHGKTYWNRDTTLPTEAFAEMFSATLTNPESLDSIKKYFPESYKIFLEMLEEILKG